jgi:hypothetical protein
MKKLLIIALLSAFLLGCATEQKKETGPELGYALAYRVMELYMNNVLTGLDQFGDELTQTRAVNTSLRRQYPDAFDVVTLTSHFDTILGLISDRKMAATDAAAHYITLCAQMKKAGEDLTIAQPELTEALERALVTLALWEQLLPEYQARRQDLIDLVARYGL